MDSNFYRAFEDRHRGPRAIIKTRLRAYLPFVEPLVNVHADVNALDLGCGRGEWLELLNEVGVRSHGVDLDEGMLSACRELSLSVETSEAVAYLKTLADESLSVVSAFHLVEHVPFEQLQVLVSQAFRVLKPAGLLIMETPNPENIVVATRNFYLDPTHERPIPPELLLFVAEFYGFARVKIVRLQESEELAERADLTLQDVLGGASPDYSVVAQKSAVKVLLAQLDAPFSREYGLSLESLTARYQGHVSAQIEQAQSVAQQAENNARQAEAKAEQAQSVAQQAENNARQAEAKAEQAQSVAQQAEKNTRQTQAKVLQTLVVAQQSEARAQLAHDAAAKADTTAQQAQAAAEQAAQTAQQAQALAQQADIRAEQGHQLLQAVLNSRSWRITAPLRWCVLQWRQMRLQGFWPRSKTIAKKILRPFASRSVAFVGARPALKNWVIGIADRLGLYKLLHSTYRRLAGRQNIVSPAPSAPPDELSDKTQKYRQMTSQAKRIHTDLTAAIKKHKEMT